MSPSKVASLSRLYYFAQTINTLTFGEKMIPKGCTCEVLMVYIQGSTSC
jgi:hypothetical protein